MNSQHKKIILKQQNDLRQQKNKRGREKGKRNKKNYGTTRKQLTKRQ